MSLKHEAQRLREEKQKGEVGGYWLYQTFDPYVTAAREGKSWFRLPKPGQLWSVRQPFTFTLIGHPVTEAKTGDWIMVVSSEVVYTSRAIGDVASWPRALLKTTILHEEKVWPVRPSLQLWHKKFVYQDGSGPC